MRIAGPAVAMATLLPTNRPAPMTPPIVIIETWRGRSERLSSLCWLEAATGASFIAHLSIALLAARRGALANYPQGLQRSSAPSQDARLTNDPLSASLPARNAQRISGKVCAHEHRDFDRPQDGPRGAVALARGRHRIRRGGRHRRPHSRPYGHRRRDAQ